MIRLKRRTAIVNMTNGQTITGELGWSLPWSPYRLHHSSLIVRGDEPARKVDGLVLVPRRNVQFVQIID
jgi:hypothetical protein